MLKYLSLAYILYNNYTIYKEEHQLKELKNRKNADIVISENDTRYTNIVAKDININSPIFSLVKQILFINSAVAESETEINDVITVLSSIEQNNGLPQATIEVQSEILPEYKSLYEENNDFFAWIRIKDTTIDYPVMHTPDYEDINFYLNKN